jgi:glycosyltransferase involved in cell wall biosynthesis
LLELRLVNVGENKGAGNALNVGFSNAKGDYVCWLSADDMFVDKMKIQRQVDYMNRKRAAWSYFRDYYRGIAYSSSSLIKTSYLPRLRILDPLFIHDSEMRLMIFLFKVPVNGSSIMIARDCVEKHGQFDPITRNVDGDGDLWMRYSALNATLAMLNGAPLFNKEHPMQTSKKKKTMLYGCQLTRMRMLLTLETKGILTKLIKKMTPIFPIVLRYKYHLAMPFVSEFIFDYISDHEKEFSCLLVKCAKKSMNKIKTHENYHAIDKEEFQRSLDTFMQSYTFKNFKTSFLVNDDR